MHAQDGLIEHPGQEGYVLDLLSAGNFARFVVQCRGDLNLEKLLFLLARHRSPFTSLVSKPVTG
jgi:hypothetical protein